MDRTVYTKATCQIFANNIEFDWENPYKTYAEYISTGTGFFINNDGIILTCAHVVEDSIKTTIIVPDNGKTKIDVELISINFEKDIALLKAINFKNKAYLELGNSDEVNEEDSVVTVGFPLGEDRIKFTGGIVSGIQGRYIQTDAPINSGNSGGPLILNKTKKVIGINTSKMTSADNIGYVSPIKDFIIIAKDMMACSNKENNEDKILTVPDLGCSFMSTDNNLLEYLGISNDKVGYMIRNLVKSSPLIKAGLKPKDILLTFGNYNVDKYGEMDVSWSIQKVHIDDMMYRYKLGDKVNITYWCSETHKEMRSVLEFNVKYPYAIRKLRPNLTPPDFEIIFGLIIMPLYFNHLEILKSLPWTRNKKNRLLSYSRKENRVNSTLIVSNVLPGSYVHEMGMIKSGDIINKVNGIEVKTVPEFREAFKKQKNGFISIESMSNNLLAIKVDNIFEHDQFLSNKYNYPMSKTILQMNNIESYIVEDKIIKNPNTQIDKFITGKALPVASEEE